jgi:hypothetical protein
MFNQLVHFLPLSGRSLFAASITLNSGAVVGKKNDYLQGLSSGVDLGRKSKKELDPNGELLVPPSISVFWVDTVDHLSL